MIHDFRQLRELELMVPSHPRGGAAAYGDRRRSWKACFAMFLPEFREKGLVTIVDAVHGGRVLHSFTHSREVK